MVEVFKTNVTQSDHANGLLDLIHETFDGYTANFDLQDCDHILRVKSNKGPVESSAIIMLLKKSGFDADVLPDEEHIGSPIFAESGVGIL
jgi:hypothetical protein